MSTVTPDRMWLQDLIAAGYRMGLPMRTLRRWAEGRVLPEADRAAVTLRLRNGEELVAELDRENADYISDCLAEGYDALRFMWFETIDGCLVGVNLAQLDAVAWNTASARSSWKQGVIVMRFTDGTSMELPRITGDAIDYLKGATLRTQRGKLFHLLGCPDGQTVSINLATLLYVTLPAAWLDSDS